VSSWPDSEHQCRGLTREQCGVKPRINFAWTPPRSPRPILENLQCREQDRQALKEERAVRVVVGSTPHRIVRFGTCEERGRCRKC